MVNTVALLSPTGQLGSKLLPALVAQQKDGKLNLIVLHRATSDVSKVPSGIEKRVFDYDSATPESVAAALKGVDILVSATSQTAPDADARFVKALATVKTLKAFLPSDYSLNYTEEEEADKANIIVHGKAVLAKQLAELGVPTTHVHNGLFELALALAGIDVKANKLTFYPAALNRAVPVTGVPYLAGVIAQLVQRNPAEIVGKTFTVVEYEATGQQWIDAFTAVNGSAPTVTDYTDADAKAARESDFIGVLAAALQKKWATGTFPNVNAYNPENVPRRNVKQAVAEVAKA